MAPQQQRGAAQPEVEIHSTEGDEHGGQAKDELYGIPRRMKERHLALLPVAPADWKRGTVAVLKCRLCPGADFSDWEIFKRHCDAAEAHPLNITLCNRCGNFFARPDALGPHVNNQPGEFIRVSANVSAYKAPGNQPRPQRLPGETEAVHEDGREAQHAVLEYHQDNVPQVLDKRERGTKLVLSRAQVEVPRGQTLQEFKFA